MQWTPPITEDLASEIESLRDIGRRFYTHGWSVGTSSNYSVVTNRDPLRLLITASGKDKGQLTTDDFVRIGADGEPTFATQPKSSAETMLHVAIANDPRVGSVLHTHSIWGTLLSDIFASDAAVTLAGYEMLKGLAGVETHASSVAIRIFENTQDIVTLADEVRQLRAADDESLRYGFLMRNHGLYTWGVDVDTCRRHVEVLEFLFEVVGRRLSLRTN